MEVKFALNPDIQNLHEQIKRYYNAIREKATVMAEEAEGILRQKIELGHINQPANRLAAMKTLTVSRDIDLFQFVLILIDYNPHSRLLDLEKFKRLPFADQLRIYKGGFALWHANLETLKDF